MVALMEPAVEYYTAQEIAAKLRVSVQTVHRMVERGDLKALRVGNRYRITRTSFEAYRAKTESDT